MSEKVYQGSCLCDGVRFTTHGEPDKVFACYCSDCLKNAGAPYQICSKMPRSAVHVSEGAEFLSTWVCKETASGHEKHKVFCSRCGCTLWTIPMHHKGEVYVVRSALLQAG
ncbi:Mss4-like protein [Bisporella sp. PMI_857]|nr:Mss4-like protein [Bisporella sp. PMI_857]